MHHDHHHQISQNTNRAFLIGASINLIYVFVEASFGFLANSLALLADAGHNLSDVFVLLLAWGANHLATLKPTARHTYGYRRATILAAFFSGVVLFITMGFIAIESIERISNLQSIESLTIVIVASIGIAINFFTAALFFKDQGHDLNVKGAYLHMIADALVSLAVVVGGLVILFTGWLLIDPILSLLIILVIAYSAWELLHDSFDLAVDAVPKNINIEQVRDYLLSLDLVNEIHDLHIWGMSTTQVALTAHLLCNTEEVDDSFLQDVTRELNERFGIDHPTIQIENGRCELACQEANTDEQSASNLIYLKTKAH